MSESYLDLAFREHYLAEELIKDPHLDTATLRLTHKAFWQLLQAMCELNRQLSSLRDEVKGLKGE